MRSFVVVALWASASHVEGVQTTIEQPATSREKSLASVLLALQPAHVNIYRPVRMQRAFDTVRASPLNMVTFSWAEIGSGDVATQLGKLTGPMVKDFDLDTEIFTEWNDNFDKFIAAAKSQGTMELLKGSGPFTLLVPVDSSIKESVDTKAHILKGKFLFDDFLAGGSAETLAGTTVAYGKAGRGKVKVEDANVKAAWKPVDNGEGIKNTAFPFDVECTNGVIHAIDEPLVETAATGSTGDYLASLGARK